MHLFAGTSNLASTIPLSAAATLTSPSVPVEKSLAPSALKASARQLPLWRRVCHCVSMVAQPSSEEIERRFLAEEGFVMPLVCNGGSEAVDGRRMVRTCPDARPRERTGEEGWTAWAKRSDGRG